MALANISGFAFGTSPHGLSVGLAASHQETPEALSLRFPAKPVLSFVQLMHALNSAASAETI